MNIGFYVQRKVGLELKLVEVKTGQTLWENSATAANVKVALNQNEAEQNFGKGVADQLVDKLAKTPLHEESMNATIKTLFSLPGFVFTGFAPGDDKNEATKAVGTTIIKDQIWKK